MISNAGRWRPIVVPMVCLLLCSSALAVSGGQLAIARAFSYGYNNPTWGGNYGGANSSPGDFAIPRGPGGAVPQYSAPLSSSASPFQAQAPMAPITIVTSGGGAALKASSSYAGNPILEGISVLATSEEQGTTAGPYLTSLAPESPASIRAAMLQGEASLRAGKYEQAIVGFETARKYWGDSPEVLLSLAHVGFAQGNASYTQAASNLCKAFQALPELLQARVRPQDFFGSVQDYDKALAKLQQYVQVNPKDAAAGFLLAYVQWRAGQLEQADSTIQAAAEAGPSKEVAAGIAAMQVGMRVLRQTIASEAPALEKPEDFAWAGIRLAVPTGFKADPLTSPNQVLTGLVTGQKGQAQLVSLYAYPMAEGVTLKAFMDTLGDSLRGMSFVKDMRIDAEAEVPFQGGTALVRLFTYTAAPRDNKIGTGWVAFSRPAASGKGQRIAYLLGMACDDSQSDSMLPTLAAVSKTIVVGEPVIPSPTALDLSGSVVENKPLRFSIVQPTFWAGRRIDRGYEMGQTDLVHGAVESPRVQVLTQTVAGTFTPESFGDSVLQRTPPKGISRTLLSKGPAKLAGQDGYQFVVSQVREEGESRAASTLVARLISLDAGEGHKTMYALVVDCRDAEPKDVEALTEKIASDFKLLPAAAEAVPAGR